MKKFVFTNLIIALVLLLSINVAYSDNTTEYHWAAKYAESVVQTLNTASIHMPEYENYYSNETIKNVIDRVTKVEKLDEKINSEDWYNLLGIVFDIDNSSYIKSISEKYITREDAIHSLIKLINKDNKLDISDNDTSYYIDLYKVSPEKRENLLIAVREGLISGYIDSSLRPKQYLRNAEAVKIIEMVCSKYELPKVQWAGNISFSKEDNYIKVKGVDAINEASWANDNSLILVYYNPITYVREASKVRFDTKTSSIAFKYEENNISLSILNEEAFKEERGYISANEYIWSNIRRYVNENGELKEIEAPYTNCWISKDHTKMLIQDYIEKEVNIFDFLTEKTVNVENYYYWADSKYTRDVRWSPDSKYFISTLYRPEDDIGIGIKNRFAVFNCETGEIVKVINNYDCYSFYPTWSPDSKKVAFLSIEMDNDDLQYALNNMIENSFNLPATSIGVFDIENDKTTYYKHPESIILGKYQEPIKWSKDSNKIYLEAALDKRELILELNKSVKLNIDKIPNEIWELDIINNEYKSITSGGKFEVKPAFFLEYEEEESTLYVVTKELLSTSPDNKIILYKKNFKNISYYENIPSLYVFKNLVTGEEISINNKIVTHYWWKDNGDLIFVENELSERRRSKTKFSIKRLNSDFEVSEIASFTQFPTKITISPDKEYVMLHEYRGTKDVKIVKL